MADSKVGKVTHYYDKIGVAVVKLANVLSTGDKIKFTGHGNEFTQEVSSMQMEHENIQKAKKGQIIGMKVDQAVKRGDQVLKVTS